MKSTVNMNYLFTKMLRAINAEREFLNRTQCLPCQETVHEIYRLRNQANYRKLHELSDTPFWKLYHKIDQSIDETLEKYDDLNNTCTLGWTHPDKEDLYDVCLELEELVRKEKEMSK